MRDWADGVAGRNYAIRREIDARNLVDLLLISMSIGFLAAVLLFHSWVRVRIVNIGYEIQQLSAEEQNLLKAADSLRLEEATLLDLGRIEYLARNELGMERLRASQLTAPAIRETETGDTSTLAMASDLDTAGGARRPASAF